MCISCDEVNKRTFGGKDNVGDTKESVCSCGENTESDVTVLHLEFHFTAVRLANPVLLHKFCLFGPVKSVKTSEKFLCVICYLEKPLCKIFSHNGASASFANAVLCLLVGKDGATRRTPVDGGFLSVCKAVLVHLKEHPLCPSIIVGHAGLDFVIPVIGCAHLLQLLFHCGNIFDGAVLGVDARLDCIVFCRQTESVKSHRVEDFLALHTLEACKTVTRAVVVPVTCVEFCPRGV